MDNKKNKKQLLFIEYLVSGRYCALLFVYFIIINLKTSYLQIRENKNVNVYLTSLWI